MCATLDRYSVVAIEYRKKGCGSADERPVAYTPHRQHVVKLVRRLRLLLRSGVL